MEEKREEQKEMERETFQSRLGFLLLSAGCAIGIGNVWKFPYMVGNNGGGIFVLFYLLFLAIMGVPILSMELAIGRGSKKSTVRAYGELEKKGQKFWRLLLKWTCGKSKEGGKHIKSGIILIAISIIMTIGILPYILFLIQQSSQMS